LTFSFFCIIIAHCFVGFSERYHSQEVLKVKSSKRLFNLPYDVFGELERLGEEVSQRDKEIINLGIGDPDIPTPRDIVEKLHSAARIPENQRYPTSKGMLKLRETIAKFYKRRFNVDVNPEEEVLVLIGTKEGITHLSLAILDPGDIAFIPDPCYPFYCSGVILANGVPYRVPLLRKNGFLPIISQIPEGVAKKAKIMFLNYPNNPTSASVELSFFKEVVSFAQKYNIVVCHENIYSDITFDGYKAPSLLQVEGARDIGIEFYSLSKTYSMAGFRIGFAIGNKKVISLMSKVKSHVDSGVFRAVQYAGIYALENASNNAVSHIYEKRRNLFVEGLNKLGLNIPKPRATFYLWIPIPDGKDSIKFAKMLLDKTGIIVAPGVGFGKYGEGYVRVSLTTDMESLQNALLRLRDVNLTEESK